MPSRDAGLIVLWPHYFDRELSRSAGRRVARDIAVDRPKAPQILKACQSLGLKAELEPEARAPRYWHQATGRVVVSSDGDVKEALMRRVAKRL